MTAKPSQMLAQFSKLRQNSANFLKNCANRANHYVFHCPNTPLHSRGSRWAGACRIIEPIPRSSPKKRPAQHRQAD
jgi:hypothetical protein